jgi:hypothetical protein
MYTIDIWACKPWSDDLCICGVEVATLAEAEEIYNDPVSSDEFCEYFKRFSDPEVWVALAGPDVEQERQVYKRKDARDSDAEWKREIAMEAGMLHGCDGYNEVMGY